MNVIPLSAFDISLAAALVIALAACTIMLRLQVWKQLLISALRTVIQLLLVGLVLKTVFEHANFGWVFLITLVMLCVAGREVMARQKYRLKGWWGFGTGTAAMFVSAFTVNIFALIVIIGPQPWYTPQYAIPLLGMLLGNTMNGISIGLDRLTQAAWQQHSVIEARLVLGHSWNEAISSIRRDSIRSGLIPIINAMAATGIVSLPGMMTGQILAGVSPLEAVKYQMLIMFLIAAGCGFGTIIAVMLSSRRLFDHRHRLRLDRLKQ